MMGDILWSPPSDWRETTELGRFMNWLAEHGRGDFRTYEELHRFSVTDLEGFWGGLWEFYGIRTAVPYDRVLSSRTMPGAKWFTGAKLNYAEHLVGSDEDRNRTAVPAAWSAGSGRSSPACCSQSEGMAFASVTSIDGRRWRRFEVGCPPSST